MSDTSVQQGFSHNDLWTSLHTAPFFNTHKPSRCPLLENSYKTHTLNCYWQHFSMLHIEKLISAIVLCCLFNSGVRTTSIVRALFFLLSRHKTCLAIQGCAEGWDFLRKRLVVQYREWRLLAQSHLKGVSEKRMRLKQTPTSMDVLFGLVFSSTDNKGAPELKRVKDK